MTKAHGNPSGSPPRLGSAPHGKHPTSSVSLDKVALPLALALSGAHLLDIRVIILSRSLFGLSRNNALYNCRTKLYPTEDGLKIVEQMACSVPIFNPDGCELREKSKSGTLDDFPRAQTSEEDKLDRSKRRARAKLNDLICCNDWKYFVTLTLDGEKISRDDYGAIIKKLNLFLGNRVRRKGLYYVGVCETHKKGGLHFHFLTNDAFDLVDSGTVIRPDVKRPVRLSTALRQGYELSTLRPVFNVTDWTLGFSTAIEVYGDTKALANYVGKYITKGTEKVGGRWYYSGGKLRKPEYIYSRIDYDTFDPDYSFAVPNAEFLVRVYE